MDVVPVEIRSDTDDPVDLDDLVRLAESVMSQLRLHPDSEVSITFVPPEAMETLHVEWLNEPGPTDVLSFPMDELIIPEAGAEAMPGLLGDVVLCYPVARDQAQSAGHSTEHELHILLAHGILHLLGLDHVEADEEREMFALQQQLVATYERESGAGTDGVNGLKGVDGVGSP